MNIMKLKTITPFMIVVILVGSLVANGQDVNQRKVDRIKRKIEKQNQKLQELTGQEYHTFSYAIPQFDRQNVIRIQRESRDKLRQAMEEQRDAMERQREIMGEQREKFQEQMEEVREKNREKLEKLKELNLEKLEALKDSDFEVFSDNGKNFKYYYKAPDFVWKGKDPVYLTPDIKVDIPDIKGIYKAYTSTGNNLVIDKELDGETSSADFIYEVKSGSDGMSVSVNGTMDAGKVKVTIKRPDGELFNQYDISPLANVKWRQNLSFGDMEESQYVGKWTVTVEAENAKGSYDVQLMGR
jgi:hypothetical protein